MARRRVYRRRRVATHRHRKKRVATSRMPAALKRYWAGVNRHRGYR